MRAVDIMSTPVVAVTGAATLREIVAQMLRSGLTAVPVVDDDGTLLGLVTEESIVHAHLVQALTTVADASEGVLVRHLMASAVAVSVPAVSVDSEATLEEIIETMLYAQVRSLPVVRDRKPIGLITLRNVLAAIEPQLCTKADR